MYTFRKTEQLKIPLTVGYQVAADIEKYHEFIHGMKAIDVLAKRDGYITAELNSHLLGGRVQMTALFKKNKSIHFRQDSGPFREFSGYWIFNEDNGKTFVSFSITMKHKNILTNKALQVLGNKLCEQIIKDFKKRAEEIIQQSVISHQLSAKTNN